MSAGNKILMIDPWVMNDYSVYLCSHLKKQGVDITLAVTENRNIISNGLPVIKMLPGKGSGTSFISKTLSYIRYLKTLYRYSREGHYKLIHFQAFRRSRMESLFFSFLRSGNAHLVYTVHDVDPLNSSRIDKFFNKMVYRSAGVLLTHSNTNKLRLTGEYKVPGSKIIVIPHGSFVESGYRSVLTTYAARKYFGLEEKHNVILFFGAIKKYKGLDLLIEALLKASGRIHNLVLMIAGQPETDSLSRSLRESFIHLRGKVKIIHHFRFIPDSEVELFFKAADIVALPYTEISHSGVLHLAWSFGKPVIASRAGDFEEFVSEGKTGFLFKTGSISELCGAIIKGFSSKNKLMEMGTAAEDMNRQLFSWEQSALKLKSVYENIN